MGSVHEAIASQPMSAVQVSAPAGTAGAWQVTMGTTRQLSLHPSFPFAFPSSHSSPGPTTPSPQRSSTVSSASA
jgi:hypothetical protein